MLGAVEEKSRCKSGIPAIRDRGHSLGRADVFNNINAVKPISSQGTLEVADDNSELVEIPRELLGPKDWQSTSLLVSWKPKTSRHRKAGALWRP